MRDMTAGPSGAAAAPYFRQIGTAGPGVAPAAQLAQRSEGGFLKIAGSRFALASPRQLKE
jgi:hypothetical protein